MEQKNRYMVHTEVNLDKLFSKIDQSMRDRIKDALLELQFPHTCKHIKKLEGQKVKNRFRKRIGNYRIAFKVNRETKEIHVYDIFHRQEGY